MYLGRSRGISRFQKSLSPGKRSVFVRRNYDAHTIASRSSGRTLRRLFRHQRHKTFKNGIDLLNTLAVTFRRGGIRFHVLPQAASYGFSVFSHCVKETAIHDELISVIVIVVGDAGRTLGRVVDVVTPVKSVCIAKKNGDELRRVFIKSVF